ncbi:Positive regulator of CheA protein activity (CheW) [Azospirillum argentinense]|uniref:chemotaxis protein CheW n=1 Tax=Azospirillum TaxID=191 RepID=UPI000D6017C8|nr:MULTISPECIES: chemotaxis protein CheW [Azospirillum]AWJ83758.1 chemotaxis protein CheW [Azospirillum sp. TSH58]MCR6630252.1 chemotaxis protein CheW [Magnetospirillum sp.]
MSSSTALATVGGTRTDARNDVMAVNAAEEQYVTFTVGSEEYGVNILSVREIRGWTPESRLPNLPDYVRGVINLRGIIIPIFDLRARFGGGATSVTKRHVVVVIQVGERTRGILVDAISDILAIGHDAIKPPPDVDGGMVDAEYLSGLYTADDRMVTLLSVEKLFSVENSELDSATKALPALERAS